jgi:hypothetical protein
MATSSDDRDAWLNQLRAEWFRVMRPFGSWLPWELRDLVHLDEVAAERPFWGEGLLHEAPQLGEEHLSGCVVVPSRTHLLARLPRGGVVAELGVLHGDFSREILQNVAPTELHLIDNDDKTPAGILETEYPGRVFMHIGDSVETLAGFDDEYFDWIYIDAQHSYEGVSRDISVSCRKIKKDGMLIFNDYTPWSYVEMQPYGVVAAVNELCVTEGWEICLLALPAHMYCDVAVRRISGNSRESSFSRPGQSR